MRIEAIEWAFKCLANIETPILIMHSLILKFKRIMQDAWVRLHAHSTIKNGNYVYRLQIMAFRVCSLLLEALKRINFVDIQK